MGKRLVEFSVIEVFVFCIELLENITHVFVVSTKFFDNGPYNINSLHKMWNLGIGFKMAFVNGYYL